MKKRRKSSKKRNKIDPMRLICWLVVPTAMIAALTADAIGLYEFTNENLIVISLSLVVILLPFFSEIKIKDLSVKRNKSETNDRT